MERRRVELGLRWKDVATAGGISYEAVRAVRHGDTDLRALTKRGIDVGLQWVPGSVQSILEGGKPVPVTAAIAAPEAVPDTGPAGGSVHDFMTRLLTDDLERFIWGTITMTEAERVNAIEELRAKRAELRADLRATQNENDLGIGLARPPRLI